MGNKSDIITFYMLTAYKTIDMIEQNDYKADFILNGIWELLNELKKI